jgi:predicted nucleotidyltransferase
LNEVFHEEKELDFAVLIGSRARGDAHAASDWDIALQWPPSNDWLAILAKTEDLRLRLAEHLAIAPEQIDLIDLRQANLAMRAAVAEEGIPLVGQEGLPWARFLKRTWRDLEDYEWERQHAA